MLDKTTDRARKALALAQEEALGSKCEHVGTEHLLIGLLAEGGGVAFLALRSLGVEAEALTERLRTVVPKPTEETKADGDAKTPSTPVYTPSAKRVLEAAVDVAGRMSHEYVGTEHLLLALVLDSESIASQVLSEMGVDPEKAEAAVQALLAEEASPPEPKIKLPIRPADIGEHVKTAMNALIRADTRVASFSPPGWKCKFCDEEARVRLGELSGTTVTELDLCRTCLDRMDVKLVFSPSIWEIYKRGTKGEQGLEGLPGLSE